MIKMLNFSIEFTHGYNFFQRIQVNKSNETVQTDNVALKSFKNIRRCIYKLDGSFSHAQYRFELLNFHIVLSCVILKN